MLYFPKLMFPRSVGWRSKASRHDGMVREQDPVESYLSKHSHQKEEDDGTSRYLPAGSLIDVAGNGVGHLLYSTTLML